MNEKAPSRFAQHEAAAQTAIDANAEAQATEEKTAARQEQVLARASQYNDRAELELFGSRGRTYTDPESGAVIADAKNPTVGKVESIKSDHRYGKTEAERLAYAEAYENDLQEMLEDGIELAQAKLLLDLNEADNLKRGKLIGDHISGGLTVEQAAEKVDALLDRAAQKRRTMILEGSAYTQEDYAALRRGEDLYPEIDGNIDTTDNENKEPLKPTANGEGEAKPSDDENDSDKEPAVFSDEDTPMFDDNGDATQDAAPLPTDDLDKIAAGGTTSGTSNESSRRSGISWRDGIRHPLASTAAGLNARDDSKERGKQGNEKKKYRLKKVLAGIALFGAGLGVGYLKFNGHDVPTEGLSGIQDQLNEANDKVEVLRDRLQDKNDKIADLRDRVVDLKGQGGGTETIGAGSWEFGDGTGGYELMENNGLTEADWDANAEEFLKKFPEESYRMPDGTVGLLDQDSASGVSTLSPQAQEFWAEVADKKKAA